jgi:hypothetical protein
MDVLLGFQSPTTKPEDASSALIQVNIAAPDRSLDRLTN